MNLPQGVRATQKGRATELEVHAEPLGNISGFHGGSGLWSWTNIAPDPSSTTCQLGDLGQLLNLPKSVFPSLRWKQS